jgi:hypothetical protein
MYKCIIYSSINLIWIFYFQNTLHQFPEELPLWLTANYISLFWFQLSSGSWYKSHLTTKLITSRSCCTTHRYQKDVTGCNENYQQGNITVLVCFVQERSLSKNSLKILFSSSHFFLNRIQVEVAIYLKQSNFNDPLNSWSWSDHQKADHPHNHNDVAWLSIIIYQCGHYEDTLLCIKKAMLQNTMTWNSILGDIICTQVVITRFSFLLFHVFREFNYIWH